MPVSINGELAIYATVDKSKKTKNQTATPPAPPAPKPEDPNPSCEQSMQNYANIEPVAHQPDTSNTQDNYMNLSFVQSLDLYENARDVLHKAGIGISKDDTEHNLHVDCHGVVTCNKCGHSCKPQDDYLMMEPGKLPCSEPVHKHFPGYLPMSPSPASTSDPIKLRLNHQCIADKAASNPSLPTSSPFNTCRKRSEPTTPHSRVSGSAMLGSYNESNSPYTRHRTGSISCLRRRSNSADATRYLDDLESITERTVSSGTSTQINQSDSNTTSVESITSQCASPKHTVVETVASIENEEKKVEEEAETARLNNSLRTLVRECLDHYDSSVHVRRSSSVPCKSVNRDSSSSNDSGVSTGSLKQRGTDFAEFELPLTTAQSTRRHHLAFHHESHCLHASLPRKSKSSDPLQELTFTFQKVKTPIKSSSAEAEVPVFPPKKEGVRGKNQLLFLSIKFCLC